MGERILDVEEVMLRSEARMLSVGEEMLVVGGWMLGVVKRNLLESQ